MLFTDIDVGAGTYALGSGGPTNSGPNSQAYTAYWNIRADGGRAVSVPYSNTPNLPCGFGPDLTFVSVRMKGKVCKDGWYVEEGVTEPKDLYAAQLKRRRGASA